MAAVRAAAAVGGSQFGEAGMSGDDRSWHIDRARQEFDAAFRADRLDIAAIHIRLSALHMARARALSTPQVPARRAATA